MSFHSSRLKWYILYWYYSTRGWLINWSQRYQNTKIYKGRMIIKTFESPVVLSVASEYSYLLYIDDYWLYFIIYSINSIIFIIKGDVMVKSHLLSIIQLFNLLNLELASESDVDVRIYSILCSKNVFFCFLQSCWNFLRLRILMFLSY